MSDVRKIKGNLKVEGDLQLPSETASRVLTVDGSGNVASSATTTTELSYLEGVTSPIQAQIDASDTAAADAQADIDAHIADAVDAHDASAISSVPAGNLAATDVQSALNELQSDIDTRALASDLTNHLNDATDAHDASAISNVPAGNLAATDVQGALNELQSDIDTRALDSAVIKKDGSVAFTADQSMGGFKLTGLATPTAPTHAATKEYVDNAIEGAKPKEAVRVATTANINLATDLEAGDVIDGVTLVAGDRVLVKNQSSPAQNGIYVAVASGAASRSTDFDSLSPVDEVNKAYVAVQEGTANQGKIFIQYGTVSTLGTDPVQFTFYNSISGLTGDDGITVSGSSISVDHDGEGLTFVAGQLALELDGATLSKSASGVRVAASVITDISNAQAAADAAQTDIDNHIADTTDAHDASAISNVPAGNLAATDVQGALNELQSDIDTRATQTALDNHLNDTTDAHDASAISVTPAGNLASTDVQAALQELQGDIDALPTGSAGDIAETSFNLANNQASPANVTGLAFANATVRGFNALVTVEIDATADLFEQFTLDGIQKGASWNMSVSSVGDDSGIVFSITSAGQVQYTSANQAGFVSGKIKFRAVTTTIG